MSKAPSKRKRADEQEKRKNGPSLLEWISGAIGIVIAVGLFSFITLEAIQPGRGNPPILRTEAVGLTGSAHGFVVVVEIDNRSGRTAAAVTVEGVLSRGGQAVETATATIAYVPGRSQRRAGLMFRRDPRQFVLDIRATGYEEP